MRHSCPVSVDESLTIGEYDRAVKIRAVAYAGIDDLLVHGHRTAVGTSDGGRRVRAILRAPIEFLTADQGRVRIFHQVSGVPLYAAAISRGPRPRPPPGL